MLYPHEREEICQNYYFKQAIQTTHGSYFFLIMLTPSRGLLPYFKNDVLTLFFK
jgi:hypothetical protein